VAAVIDRHTQQVFEMTRSALGRAPIEVAAREFVGVAIEAHRINPKLHGVRAEQIPFVGRLENIQANVREGYALVRSYLEAHRDEIDVADLDLGSFVLLTAVKALTHAAVLRRPDILRDEESTAVCGQRHAPRDPVSASVAQGSGKKPSTAKNGRCE
jgi:hypothetical protein